MPKAGKNIYLRKDGRWEGRFVRDRVDGRIRYGYVFGKTREEVERRLPDRGSGAGKPGGPTFADTASDWLRVRRPQLKESSISRYMNILDLHLIPAYGERAVEGITRGEVTSYALGLLPSGDQGGGLAPKTVNGILSVMKNIFKYAEREKGLAVADIADLGVKQPAGPSRILSLSEQQRLCSHLCAHLSPCGLGILLCLYMGLRIGELCALKWSDINLDDRILHVRRTMQRIQTRDGAPRRTKVVILPPKSSSSIREIPIPEEMHRILASCRKDGGAYLLTGKEDCFIEPRTMENLFKRAAAECHVQDIRFHALRHTFATRCVERGFDIKSLSEILGHANVNVTLNRYVHPSLGLKQENMDKLSGFIP